MATLIASVATPVLNAVLFDDDAAISPILDAPDKVDIVVKGVTTAPVESLATIVIDAVLFDDIAVVAEALDALENSNTVADTVSFDDNTVTFPILLALDTADEVVSVAFVKLWRTILVSLEDREDTVELETEVCIALPVVSFKAREYTTELNTDVCIALLRTTVCTAVPTAVASPSDAVFVASLKLASVVAKVFETAFTGLEVPLVCSANDLVFRSEETLTEVVTKAVVAVSTAETSTTEIRDDNSTVLEGSAETPEVATAEEFSVVTGVSMDKTRADVVARLEVVVTLEGKIEENEDRRAVELYVTTSMTAASVEAISPAFSSLAESAFPKEGTESAVEGSDCCSRSEPGARASSGISDPKARIATSEYKSHETRILTRCSCRNTWMIELRKTKKSRRYVQEQS